MMISYGVCDQLDEMKHTYHGLPDFLTKVSYLCLRCKPHKLRVSMVVTVGEIMQDIFFHLLNVEIQAALIAELCR